MSGADVLLSSRASTDLAPPTHPHTPSPHPSPQPLTTPNAQVRAYLGIPVRPEAAGIDTFQRAAAVAFLVYALFAGLTGKKV